MSARAPSAIAMRRIQSELNDWLVHPPEGCNLIKFEPLLVWIITMTGPDSAPGMPQLYAGETFRVQIKFTDHYPLESPEVLLLAAHIAVSRKTPNAVFSDITSQYINNLCRLHLFPQALCIRISTAMATYAWTFFTMVEMGAGHLH
ncbi:hypothetical protein ABBQ32_003286 [Trebouxia sp. C0010 RCD-2024]